MKTQGTSRVVSTGVGPTGLLGIVFIVLKLVGVIDWSWWWVLAPFWIPFALAILIAAVIVIFLVITDA